MQVAAKAAEGANIVAAGAQARAATETPPQSRTRMVFITHLPGLFRSGRDSGSRLRSRQSPLWLTDEWAAERAVAVSCEVSNWGRGDNPYGLEAQIPVNSQLRTALRVTVPRRSPYGKRAETGEGAAVYTALSASDVIFYLALGPSFLYEA